MNSDPFKHCVQDSPIGWISTADSLLFGLGLILVIALLLSGKLGDERAENEMLDSANSELANQKKTLESHNASLVKQVDSAQETLDSKTAEAELQRQAARKAQQKANQLAEQLEQQKEVWAKKLDELRKLGSEVWKKYVSLTKRFEKAKQAYLEQTSQIDELNDELEKAAASKSAAREYEEKYKVLQASYETLKTSLSERNRTEKRVRSELIGLKGDLNRVAILFDASESMKEGDRWESAQKVMATWVEHLDMDECILIVFNEVVETYPNDGTLLDLSSDEKTQNRSGMLKYLEKIVPLGRTNTLAALEKAYSFEQIDTIVLFTDGAPYLGAGTQRSDEELIAKIYTRCREKSEIPINAVGLGNYFSPELSEFLINIADITSGTFVGR